RGQPPRERTRQRRRRPPRPGLARRLPRPAHHRRRPVRRRRPGRGPLDLDRHPARAASPVRGARHGSVRRVGGHHRLSCRVRGTPGELGDDGLPDPIPPARHHRRRRAGRRRSADGGDPGCV
ncbi:MAG: hypothetical protein AVDCRST_MAG19-3359, partial [uncultured Thermomicrobiales bacterium]